MYDVGYNDGLWERSMLAFLAACRRYLVGYSKAVQVKNCWSGDAL